MVLLPNSPSPPSPKLDLVQAFLALALTFVCWGGGGSSYFSCLEKCVHE